MPTLTPTPLSERPDRPDRRQSKPYPAGRAIAVVLLALFLAALLDADSLVASISSERFGTARSIELALVRPFRTVSDAIGLNLPHRWLAGIAGTNQTNPGPLVVPTGVTPGARLPSPTAIAALINPARGRRPAPATRSVVPAPRRPPVKPRTPTAAAPLKIWLAGDSLMGDVANAFVAHVTGNPAVKTTENVQIGTGLARPDVYDWPGVIAQEMARAQPNVVVLTFGANDDQDMVAGNHYLVRATPAWQAEYARRVALVMSEVAVSGRMLVWVEVPPVARPRLQQTNQIIDAILRSQARAHPGVVLVDPGPVLAPAGVFAAYLPGSSGQPVQVRTSDGVHLTPAGAQRVLPLLLAAIRTEWALA